MSTLLPASFLNDTENLRIDEFKKTVRTFFTSDENSFWFEIKQ